MSESAFDYLYARYFVECARNGSSPLTPDELRALIEALAEASQREDGELAPRRTQGGKPFRL